MSEELMSSLEEYVLRNGLQLDDPLGTGIHGTVFSARRKGEFGGVALKAHSFSDPYERERNIYLRLMSRGVWEIRGLTVPQLCRYDDELLVLEMTAVAPPYILDFAGGYLDRPPRFSAEIWADWTEKNAEQFGSDWPAVQQILSDLQDLGIHLHDLSTSNIRFR